MFDYQAGEKYRLTLIMVGVAGLIAGMFIALLLMPSPEPSGRHRKGGGQSMRVMTNPDITGVRGGAAGYGSPDTTGGAEGGAGQQQGSAPQVSYVDKATAHQFMNAWLYRVWDLSASTAASSQAEAIKYMTPECANAYQQNVWTPGLAKQVQESGIQSRFEIKDMQISDPQSDGSVIIKVKGVQSLGSGTKSKARDVSLEYLMKQTPDGPRISGISDSANR